MNDIAKLGLKLFALAAVAGLALGVTNAVTEAPIARQAQLDAEASRSTVLPETAETFALVSEQDGAVTDIYAASDASGALVGYTGCTTVTGFGGPIEITVGLLTDGTVYGVSVGGSDFAETAGLGARTRETWFGAQFSGLNGPFALDKDGGEIDAVTSATISSTAVINGANTVFDALAALCKEGN